MTTAPQSLDLVNRSASTVQPPSVRESIKLAKLIDVSTCIGCKACQVACAEWNDVREDELGHNVGVYDNPLDLSPKTWTVMRFSEYADLDGRFEWLIRKDGCMHCADPGCLRACPAPGAIVQFSNGIVDFVQDNCIGCGNCISGCPFNIPRLSREDGRVYKCTLCSDRVAVGLEPACIKTCPTGALQFGSKQDMQDYAAHRVADLRARGYQHAGLYDPPGVGGTHVMYVLKHVDRPQLYHALPNDPKVSGWVRLWRGPAKPLALFAMAATALAGLVHYLKLGPNVVDRDATEAPTDHEMPERGA